jgi:hypothetical protein
MNWKSLLAVFIIVAILGLLMVTDVGQKYTQYLSTRVGSFLSSVLDLDFFQGGESFKVLLETDSAAFYGQSYEVSNSSMYVSGICQSSVTVGKTIMQMSGKRCTVQVNNAKGRFDYTVGGSVKLTGKAEMLTVNDYPFLSTGEPFEVSFEVIPIEDFNLAGISQNKIELDSVSGSVKGWKGDTVLNIDNLSNDGITISKFNGDIKMEGDVILLVGLANSVKGEDFSW